MPNTQQFPISLPVLIEEDFIYPFAIAPIFTQGERNIKAANAALDRNDLLIVCCQKPEDFGASKHEAQDHAQATAQGNSLAQMPFYDVGVVCKILRKVSLCRNGRVKILVPAGIARSLRSLRYSPPKSRRECGL